MAGDPCQPGPNPGGSLRNHPPGRRGDAGVARSPHFADPTRSRHALVRPESHCRRVDLSRARHRPREVAAAAAPDDVFSSLRWREVGPYRGGRSAAVAGVPSQPDIYYFGSVGGGVWKTDDGGKTWKNVSDGFFGGSIGAWRCPSRIPTWSTSAAARRPCAATSRTATAMWKSTDAGKTWTHIGLGDSRHVPRVRIHPRDPDLVYAAVLGHLFGPNEERGVYRSTDGGTTWERILFANANAGAIDLVLDPTQPARPLRLDLARAAHAVQPRERRRRARRSGSRPTAATPGTS